MRGRTCSPILARAEPSAISPPLSRITEVCTIPPRPWVFGHRLRARGLAWCPAWGLAWGLLVLALLAGRPAGAQPAPDDPWTACRRAILAAERGNRSPLGPPPGLLLAIALVETGRADGHGRVEPWPWSWNAGGEGHAESTREAAIARVGEVLASGRRSVDIGCMQVNLLHHPAAFVTLEEGFDPAANLRYALRFLLELRGRTGNWADAIAQYHSGEAERGMAYQRRVALARLGAAWAAGGMVPLPVRSLAGLCAPGLAPALVIRKGGGGARPRLGCRRDGQRGAQPVRRPPGSAPAPG